MYLSREEENRNRIVSLSVSIGFLALIILLCLFVLKIITPNPPFPEGGGSDGIEFNIGNLIEGTGNVENNGIGEAPKVVESTEVTPNNTSAENPNDNIVTSEVGEDVNIKKNEAESQPKTTTVVVPVKPKEKTAAELLAEKFNKNKGKTGGGDGNSGEAGNEGKPDGNPNTHGNGGDSDHGDGTSKGPGGLSTGNGITGFSLAGRSIVTKPPISKDTKEEGTVVVEIVVDKNGNVIKADAVGRGTNTNSIMLKTKARQAALATKFNVGSNFEEQRGTITFVFSF